jgi:isochorismate synthase
MSSYAIYRLPHEDHATQIRQTEGEPVELKTLTELNGRSGFVVAPFEVTDSQPILVIQGEAERVDLLSRSVECGVWSENTPAADSSLRGNLTPHSTLLTPSYKVDFANFHSQLENDTFRKIVLARCADEVLEKKVEPIELFYRACALYPRLFVALVDTKKSGCWLTATP